MKHIKLFEDYSDEELKNLMGDLEGIGHKYKLIRGEDFGLETTLKGGNMTQDYLYITPETFKILKDKGIIIKELNSDDLFVFSDKESWGYRGVNSTIVKKYNLYRIESDVVHSTTESKLLTNIMKKLGEIPL